MMTLCLENNGGHLDPTKRPHGAVRARTFVTCRQFTAHTDGVN